MDEHDIRGLVAEVKQGTLSRRSFLQTMAAVGIAAPVASQILLWNDVAMADATLAYKPTKAGGGGPLKMLVWQAPTLLNPHFALGTKDQIASRVFSSRSPAGTRRATSSPASLPKSRPRPMAASPPTAPP